MKYFNLKGQATVEFAIISLILLIIILGGIQIGIILNTYLSVCHLTREAARYAAVNSGKTDSEILNYIFSIKPANLNSSSLDISINPPYSGGTLPSTRYTGCPISVGIKYNLSTKMFLPSSFFGINLPTELPRYTITIRVERL